MKSTKNTTIPSLKDQEYIIEDSAGKETSVFARTPSQAVSIHLRGKPFRLGVGWTYTRLPSGSIIAVNKSMKTMQRQCLKLREKNYSRFDPKFQGAIL